MAGVGVNSPLETQVRLVAGVLFSGAARRVGGARFSLEFSDSFSHSFLASFPVRFFSPLMFSTTSPLRFSVRSGSFFRDDPLFSTTSPVRFSKNEFFVPQF
ncbi:MAG: hypothetical protein EPN47_00345 [Acidobacteria bacterium]|nr:MAG: hypothetical protein EPN47_00345 [Acidobacteriota bacterium]